MNSKLFKAYMTNYGDTLATLAEAMGLSPSRLSQKINEADGASFWQNEIAFIIQRYSLSPDEAFQIFFAESSVKRYF